MIAQAFFFIIVQLVSCLVVFLFEYLKYERLEALFGETVLTLMRANRVLEV